MTKPDLPFLVFGYASPEATDDAKRTMTELATMIGAMAQVDLAVSALPSYDRVAQLVHKGKIDLAWVSPIPYIALLRNERVLPLACPRRGDLDYHGAIVVSASSTISKLADLAGKRAAWVDRYSAAGFVVPRIELAKAGLDVKSAFSQQRFFGSHEAAVRAVAEGAADFAATFVRLGANNAVIGGPWTKMPGLEPKLRIFATFGVIPPDVVAARSSLDAATRERLEQALKRLTQDPRGKELVSTIFGADDLVAPTSKGYEELRLAAAEAVQEKLLDIEEDLEPEIVFDPKADQTLKMKVPG